MVIEQNFFKRQEMMISPEASKMIKNLRILVVGAGAGGNEMLKNLLLMGFGNITIIDFDTVEDSNLSRTTLFKKEDIGKSKSLTAAQRLQEMALHDNPHIVGLHGNLMTDFGKGIFLEHDVVFCCVDTQKCRAYINDWCVRTRTPFFEMGFREYTVDVCFFAPEGKMTQRNGKVIDKLPTDDGYFPKFNNDFSVCLREEIGQGFFEEKRNPCSRFKVEDTNFAKIPTIQVSAAMAGTFCATELMKFLDGKDSIRNKMLMYFGLTFETIICNFKRNPDCKIHDEKYGFLEMEIASNATFFDVIDKLEQQTSKNVLLKLPDEFIISGKCHICGKPIIINKRSLEVWDKERWCEDCRNEHPDFQNKIEYGNDFLKVPRELTHNSPEKILSRKICESGIPQNDIVEVITTDSNSLSYNYVYLKTIEK
ncbi:MAG: ThiF family adenylyltransferase [Bacteroidales bacterium]|nr:ThiF family adenylyltransferase [Bacteroidales bacterium]